VAGSRHRVAPLRSHDGREALLDEVWGPPSRRRRARGVAKAGASGAAGGGILDACSGCNGCDAAALEGEALIAIGVVLLVAVAAVIVYYVGKKLIEYIRRRRNRLVPAGALRRGASVGRGRAPRIGTVVADEREPTSPAPPESAALGAPLSMNGEPYVAYALELRRTRRYARGQVMLRDAATAGFAIELDDGQRVRVPPGPIALDARSGDRVDADGDAIVGYLERLDPERKMPRVQIADEHAYDDPFPRDRAWVQTIAPGARVAVYGSLRRAPLSAADAPAHGGYRDAAPSVLAPEGLPRLAVVNGDGQ
jgi:hypothetical protein